MIEVIDLTKSFADVEVLKGVSLKIGENKTLGVLGPNGAGKSTTLKILATLLKPTSGKVKIDNIEVADNYDHARSLIAFLPESPPLYPELSVTEYLTLFGNLRADASGGASKIQIAQEVKDNIARCRLTGFEDKLCGVLSKGFRQKVGLAAALMGQPKILLLDEPTSGLDPREIVEIRSLIKNLKKSHTILFSSHILSEVS